jgi:hypothetical protein
MFTDGRDSTATQALEEETHTHPTPTADRRVIQVIRVIRVIQVVGCLPEGCMGAARTASTHSPGAVKVLRPLSLLRWGDESEVYKKKENVFFLKFVFSIVWVMSYGCHCVLQHLPLIATMER